MSIRSLLVVAMVMLLCTVLGGRANAQEPTGAEAAAAAAGNAFGYGLLKQLVVLGHDGDNVFISPISVTQALGLLYIGSSGTTKTEIGKALHVDGESDEDFAAATSSLENSLKSTDPDLDLSIANAIWSQSGRPFGEAYQQDAKKIFDADAKSVDFLAPVAAALSINNWVSKNTDGKIPTLVTPGVIRGASSVLTNAVYFKGSWAKKFDTASTRPADFTLTDGSTIQIPTMHRSEEILSYFDPSVTVLSLPYGGTPATSMIIVLPAVGTPLKTLLGTFDSKAIENFVSQLQNKPINLYLPKFHAEYSADITSALQSQGIEQAFTHNADLSPMGIPGNYVSGVIHKSIVDVDEQGTVAAGATGVIMRSLAMMVPQTVKVDHPFICAIRDDQTGALLFLGAINHPMLVQ